MGTVQPQSHTEHLDMPILSKSQCLGYKSMCVMLRACKVVVVGPRRDQAALKRRVAAIMSSGAEWGFRRVGSVAASAAAGPCMSHLEDGMSFKL
eukprot:1161182-Pelagomonas_calceolata.AAC.1